MPKIMIAADHHTDTDTASMTLSERISAEHLRDIHYAAQLIERLSWATADAEALALPAAAQQADAVESQCW